MKFKVELNASTELTQMFTELDHRCIDIEQLLEFLIGGHLQDLREEQALREKYIPRPKRVL